MMSLGPKIFCALMVVVGGTHLAARADFGAATTLGLTALLVAIASALLARSLRQPLTELRAGVEAIRAGRGQGRSRPRVSSELGKIASAIDRDAAALRAALDASADDKQQLEAVLAAMVEGVLVLDQDGRVTLANPRLRELLDIWTDIDGRRPLELVRNSAIDEALRAAASNDEVVIRELEGVGPEERAVLMHAARVASGGPRAGTVAVFHDVSEIRRLEQVRTDFIANASHELRTPLTSIQGYADMLLAGPALDAATESALRVIDRNARRLNALVEDLLELSRIEGRRSPLRPGETDVRHICAQLAEDAIARLDDAGVSVRVEGEAKVLAWADPRALEHVISNLLDNAIKYTEAGGKIWIRPSVDQKTVTVEVTDTGIGIPEEDQNRVFERFYRVDKARARALGGTGLGLSIVKNLVQAMHGEIYLESVSGKGSTFRFTLPNEPPPTGSAS